jgi:hypothetical protein
MSLHTSYHADSDADDEYERSVITSPHLHIDSESSPTDSDIHSAEHTPTKFGHPMDGPRSPRTLITEWGVEECKEFLTSLGLLQYHGTFRGKWTPRIPLVYGVLIKTFQKMGLWAKRSLL